MHGGLPRLRWVIVVPVAVTALLLVVSAVTGSGRPSVAGLVRTGVLVYLAVSFLLIGGILIYRLLVDGFDREADC